MRWFISGGSLWAVALCFIGAAACSDKPSEAQAPGTSNPGGTSGTAGDATVGGSSGAGGVSGASGGTAVGGTAGAGGTDSAGTGSGGTMRAGSGGEGENSGGDDSGGSSSGNAGGGAVAGGAMGGAGGSSGSGAAGGSGGVAATLNMFLMFDRSGSMNECTDGTAMNDDGSCPSPPSRWDLAAAGLTAFVRDSGAQELGIALRFFPHDLPIEGCNGDDLGMALACDPYACSMPLVDLGRLTGDPAPTDAHEAALTQAIAASAPSLAGVMGIGGTPIYPALAGALSWAENHQAQYPSEITVVVLVTDGEPNGCDESWGNINQRAADAMSTAGIRTFAVGLTDVNGAGVNMDDMDSLAVAGGTERAYFVADGATTSADMLAALNEIRSRI